MSNPRVIITPEGIQWLDGNGNVTCSFGIDMAKANNDEGITIMGNSDDAVDAMRYNIEEEENMERNKVLDLYVERRRKAIKEVYENNYMEEYNNLPVVKEYNEIVGNFEAQLAELSTRELASVEYLGYKNDYGYVLNHKLLQDVKDKHYAILKEAMDALDDKANEVHALLSLSDDKDYQLEVLVNYGILDKKTKTLTI